jgi:L-amino acid N-acyltransferase YncA
MSVSAPITIRAARPEDAASVAAIYTIGIDERTSTFEARPRTAADMLPRIQAGTHPFLVADRDGQVVGWAALAQYSDRAAYAGIAECSVYVDPASRGHRVGTRLLDQLIDDWHRRGGTKVLGKLFQTNQASRRLVARCGFRDVGVHLRHGRLDGAWRDVLLVERLLDDGRSD